MKNFSVILILVIIISACKQENPVSIPDVTLDNHAPVIEKFEHKGFEVEKGGILDVECVATDQDDGDLAKMIYTWTLTPNIGFLKGSGKKVQYNAPDTLVQVTLKCEISDNKGGTDSDEITLNVINPR